MTSAGSVVTNHSPVFAVSANESSGQRPGAECGDCVILRDPKSARGDFYTRAAANLFPDIGLLSGHRPRYLEENERSGKDWN